MSQPTEPTHTTDEEKLLTALARLAGNTTESVVFESNEAGVLLTARNRVGMSLTLFLHRASDAVYHTDGRDLAAMTEQTTDARLRSRLEVVWRNPGVVDHDTVTVVMTETIVFKHTFTRAELAETLGCPPAHVEQQIVDHGDDDDVWLRETLAEHFSHVSDRDLSVEVTR